MLKNLMRGPLITADPHAKVFLLSKLMSEHDVGCILILENGKPRGLVTDRDIVLRCIAQNKDAHQCSAQEIMSHSLATVQETQGVFECIEMMKSQRVRRIPVVNDQGLAVGIISFGDLLSLLGKEMSEITQGTTPDFEERKPAPRFKQVA